MEKVKRMRTIKESLKMIKESDKNSSITYNAIRNLCINGSIPYVMVGNRIILNFDALVDYLKLN